MEKSNKYCLRWSWLTSAMKSHIDGVYSWCHMLRMHFTFIVFLTKTHYSSLIMRKSPLSGFIQLDETLKTGHEMKSRWSWVNQTLVNNNIGPPIMANVSCYFKTSVKEETRYKVYGTFHDISQVFCKSKTVLKIYQ